MPILSGLKEVKSELQQLCQRLCGERANPHAYRVTLPICVSLCLAAYILQINGHLYYSSTYWLAHLLFFTFLPLVFLTVFPNKRILYAGLVFSALFHYCYEFYEDQFDRPYVVYDWDQIASGTIGLVIAWAIGMLLVKQPPEPK